MPEEWLQEREGDGFISCRRNKCRRVLLLDWLAASRWPFRPSEEKQSEVDLCAFAAGSYGAMEEGRGLWDVLMKNQAAGFAPTCAACFVGAQFLRLNPPWHYPSIRPGPWTLVTVAASVLCLMPCLAP